MANWPVTCYGVLGLWLNTWTLSCARVSHTNTAFSCAGGYGGIVSGPAWWRAAKIFSFLAFLFRYFFFGIAAGLSYGDDRDDRASAGIPHRRCSL